MARQRQTTVRIPMNREWVEPKDGEAGYRYSEPKVPDEIDQGTVVSRRREGGHLVLRVRPRTPEAEAAYQRQTEVARLEAIVHPKPGAGYYDTGKEAVESYPEALAKLAELDPGRYRAMYEADRASREKVAAENAALTAAQQQTKREQDAALAANPYREHEVPIVKDLEASGLPAEVTRQVVDYFVRDAYDGNPDGWTDAVKDELKAEMERGSPDFAPLYYLNDQQYEAFGEWAGFTLPPRKDLNSNAHVQTRKEYLASQELGDPEDLRRQADAIKDGPGTKAGNRKVTLRQQADRAEKALEQHRKEVVAAEEEGWYVPEAVRREYL
jgi:hypothetical protein